MATEREKEGKRRSWESCMEEFILYVSPNWSPWQFLDLLIHMWQQINLVSFQMLPISTFRLKSWTWSYLYVSLHMNLPVCAHMCQVWSKREESEKSNESTVKPGAPRSHYLSLQTGTLDFRSLAYFSCCYSANSDYYPTVQYLESEHCWFSPASLLLLGCDWMFQDAHCCWWQGDTLSGSDCSSSVQSKELDLDGIFTDTIINSWTHFQANYYFVFYIHFYFSLMVGFQLQCINVWLCTLLHKYWASCSTIVRHDLDISYTFFSNHSLVALMLSGVQ